MHPFFTYQNAAERLDDNVDNSIALPQDRAEHYYFGRLVWCNMTTFAAINNWEHTVEDIISMHQMLDLKDHLEQEAMKRGQDGN